GQCGCGFEDTDADGDGYATCQDECEDDPKKTRAGQCGCGVPDIDKDKDGVASCIDACDNDKYKTEPGVCGCGVADIDKDEDGVYSCEDQCDLDPLKIEPGQCGCGEIDIDSDGDGVADCRDACPLDPEQSVSGDSDKDGIVDCLDACPFDPDKTETGVCGCGVPDADWNEDGNIDCGIELKPYCAQKGFDTVRWLVINHLKQQVQIQTLHNNPLSVEPGVQRHYLTASGNELVTVVRNVDSPNPLSVVVNENTIFTQQHPMRECEPARVPVSGKITGKNGRPLSARESKLLKKIQDNFTLRVVARRYVDTTAVQGDVNVETGEWTVLYRPLSEALIQLFSGEQLMIRSKPKSYRPYIDKARSGFNFAVRPAKLRGVYKTLKKRSRSRKQ
ncbi:MAG: hypothetical protein KDD55_07880, partial [Bdellovibrionales bacterium]|nr:hypothetical protein [Bdellovibrionales bacterium]